MARTELSLSLNGNTFKILYVYYRHSMRNEPIGMRFFYRKGKPLERLGWNAMIKAFSYLRRNKLIIKISNATNCYDYEITSKGSELLYNTLLKRQEQGLSYSYDGICLEANPNTKQISLKENLDNGTNTGQIVQITP
jgi:hypothetical protein